MKATEARQIAEQRHNQIAIERRAAQYLHLQRMISEKVQLGETSVSVDLKAPSCGDFSYELAVELLRDDGYKVERCSPVYSKSSRTCHAFTIKW